jgi:hypothetical protein
MDVAALLVDAFGRIHESVRPAVEGLTVEQLAWRPDPDANSIAWLVWHLTRIEDDHVADVAGREQAWMTDGWYEHFALPFPKSDHGYGHTSEQVGQVRASADALLAHHDAVHDKSFAYLGSLTAADLDRIVDTRWDPPVTLGVRLVSVTADGLEHAGQAAYLRGLVERTGI